MINSDWLISLNSLDSDDPQYLQQAIALLVPFYASENLNANKFKALLIQVIAQIDTSLSKQLSLLVQQPAFQTLEARWQGLKNLVTVPYSKQRVKVKCLDIDWQAITNDVNLSSSVKRSQLYNKIANKELNTLGGEPFGVMVIDHHVSAQLADFNDFDDLYTLELLGALGQQCLCPFVMSPDERFFGEADGKWLSDIERVGKIINGVDYASWQKLRQLASSRFIALTMPRLKLRSHYQNYSCGFVFNEVVNAKQAGLYGYAHFAFVATIVREFNRISWFGFLKSRWNDRLQGAVLNVPETCVDHQWLQPEPRIRLFGKIAQFYAKQGFIPLAHSPLTTKYYFMDNHSVWAGQQQADDKVLSLLQTTLICSRIAHFLKVQIRELLGSLLTATECEQHLSQWLSKYVSNVSSANDETLAKYPLRNARVKVREADNSPGEFICEVSLQPQYQFDMFAGQIMLTTELAKDK
ncbi:MAG: type VI secretion system contractile sheath large subunit [Colwellia sp.]